MLGGLSSGAPLVVRVAVKPTPSIGKEQHTVNLATMKETTLTVGGRHDACIVPRAVAAVEAAMALTLADLALRADEPELSRLAARDTLRSSISASNATRRLRSTPASSMMLNYQGLFALAILIIHKFRWPNTHCQAYDRGRERTHCGH